jgi:hypothetical protein
MIISLVTTTMVIVVFVIQSFELRKLNRQHNLVVTSVMHRIIDEKNKQKLYLEKDVAQAITEKLQLKLKIIIQQTDVLIKISSNLEN